MLRNSFKQIVGKNSSRIGLGAQPLVGCFHSAPPTNKPEEAATSSLAEKQADDFLNSLPGSNKAYSALIATSVATIALSKEYIPYTADIVYAVPFTLVAYLGFKYVGPMLSGIKDKIVTEREKIWNEAKSKAEAQLESKIHEITGSGITDLVEVTNQLFDHAEEVGKMEALAFEHEQSVAYYAKAKQILDDWVRYETAEREREQRRISEEVIARVMEAVADPQFQEKYLEQCIGEIEGSLAK